ncbi:GRP family sugar transporter [Lacticaseibacillus thailandensis]|uniref:Glucose uptake protein n=1 Tax=Lacticaseibacillus thailandensis DSM 22698 = JCM 13996 TaxID=1423810 RepID=A0A0R2C9L3_9LACO|nr:GRP family sugar transporter [Lacticaseibacillus thailandensis]KRM88392.1 glucose uptake protein [Lacticaseibacillus thailandensis DSM 22698 = JCM 13996]
MNILIALIPAIGWGIQPMIISKMGGRETNQILGTGLGALLVGAITLIMTRMVTGAAFWLSLVSGAFWVIGQTGQYISFGRIGVSKTMPLSTGFQLVGTSLIGVLMFGEWQGSLARVLGFAAIALIIIGVLLTTVGEKSDGHTHSIWGPALTTLLPTSIGYWVYSALPKIPLLADKSGMSYFFPQMLGIFLGASVYALVVSKGKAFSEATTWKNGLVGIVFSISALAYIFSAKANGVATAYVITQLNVVISTLGGMFILHEARRGRAMTYTLLGLLLVVVGSVVTAFL